MRKGIWEYYFISWLFFTYSSTITLGDVIFPSQYDAQLCLDQPVEYQCTVTGSGFLWVLWKVLRDDGTQFIEVVTFVSTANAEPPETIGGGIFTVELLSQSPLISNISFTVQSSINGCTIVCEDHIKGFSKNLTIQVPDSSPGDVIIHTDTLTNSSVNISWTESPPFCNTTYRYNVSSTAPGWVNIIMESTSNSVTVEGLVPSDDQYCVMVTAIDRYSTRSSDNQCFLFNVPPQVEDVTVNFTMDGITTTNITVNWNGIVTHNNLTTAAVVPILIGYTITITGTHSSTGQYTVMGPSNLLLPPDTTEYTFTGYPAGSGINYTISITAINRVGGSIPSIVSIEVPFPIPDATMRTNYSATVHDSFQSSPLNFLSPSSTSQISLIPLYTGSPFNSLSPSSTSQTSLIPLYTDIIPLVLSTPSITATTLAEYTDRQDVATVAGISVAITVPVTAVITAIITVIILYLCGCLRLNKRSDHHHSATTNGRLSRQESINTYSRPPSEVLINSSITDDDDDLRGIDENTAYSQVNSTHIEGISALRPTRTESPTVLMNTSHRMTHNPAHVHQTTEPTHSADGDVVESLELESNVAYGQTTANGYGLPPRHYEVPLSLANGISGSQPIPYGSPSSMITNGAYAEVILNYNINATGSGTANNDNNNENTVVYYDTIPGSN